jgi:hypothetical protein
MDKNLSITWDGKPGEVVVGEITWKQKTDAIRKSMRDVMRGRQLKREPDVILQKEMMVVASIKSAPFDVNIENFQKLSSKDGERLFKLYSELNELSEENEEGEESAGEE